MGWRNGVPRRLVALTLAILLATIVFVPVPAFGVALGAASIAGKVTARAGFPLTHSQVTLSSWQDDGNGNGWWN